jgi:UDPglucose--hexose-1-phosphate uridylyltransferase
VSDPAFEALSREPHRRFNPLTGEWVLVSPQRDQRPWQGQVEAPAAAAPPAHDASCYLCPSNARSGGARNPDYKSVFAFDNDFAALKLSGSAEYESEGLLKAETESGICRVLCYSPRHDLALSTLDAAAARAVVDLWVEEYKTLGARDDVGYVQLFENRGVMMGASSPHPHGQVWASRSLPDLPGKEQTALQAFARERGECLLCSYAKLEAARGERLVAANPSFVAVVPFWAVWPYETLVLPRAHRASVEQLCAAERDDLASLLRRLTAAYDRVFSAPFPYSMGFHQRPTDGESRDEWHLHAHFFPPLLRSATVRKFLVGYEMLAAPQRDLTAESAAARLRGCVRA